jgi:hypothetical protein
MKPSTEKKYGSLRLERGGKYAKRPNRTVTNGPLMHELDRRIHDVFVTVHDAGGKVPSRGIYDIRCGAQHPARVIGRRCIEMRQAGADVDQVAAVFAAGEQWVREILFAEPSGRGRAA